MPWLVIGPKVGSLHVRQVASNAVMSESDQSTYCSCGAVPAAVVLSSSAVHGDGDDGTGLP
jgi:hypothetical protein